MPVITVSKAVTKEQEYVITSDFSISEMMMMNHAIKSMITDTSDALPFVIRRVIMAGAIPIYNTEFTYETRVLVNKIIHGIDLNNSELKDTTIKFDKVLSIIPSNTPINVVYLYTHDGMFKTSNKYLSGGNIVIGETMFLNKPVIDYKLAPILEESITTRMNFLYSYVSAYLKSLTYVPEPSIPALTYQQLKPIIIDRLLIDFYKENSLEVPICEYSSTPIDLLIKNNLFEDFIHKFLGSSFRRDRMAETKFMKSTLIKDYVMSSKYMYAYKTLYGANEWLKLKVRNNLLSTVIQAIPKDKLETVESEIQRQDKFWRELLSNKCPHMDVIRAYNIAVTVEETKSAFDQLVTYIDEKHKDLHSYLDCKLCKFRLICPHKLIQMDYVINDRTFDYVKKALYPFADEGKDYLVTCKVCNEGLYYQQFTDLMGDHNPITSAEDKKALWHDATFMLHTYVKFTESLYDKTNLIRIMVNACYESIMGLVSTLAPGISVDKWRTIYADLVFAAFLLNLEKNTKGKIKFDYKTYLSSIPITNKRKTEKMIEQYRMELSDIHVRHIEKQEVPKEFVLTDPINLFAAEVMKKDVYELIGKKTYDKLEISDNVVFGGLEDTTHLGKLRNYQLVLIYNKLVAYGKNNLWDIPGDIIGPNSEDKTSIKMLEEIDKIDKLNAVVTNSALQRPISQLPCSGSYANPIERTDVSLAEIFAPDGTKLSWDKLVYGSQLVDKKEGSFNKYGLFTDMYSSKWDLYRTDARTKDDNDVKNILESIALTDTLMSYYFSRCPEGNIHDKLANGKCKKCGLYPSMSKEDISAYVVKYKKIYEKDKTEIEQRNSINIQSRMSVSNIPTTIPDISVELTDDMLRIMSERFTIPVVFFKYLAVCEGHLYEDILTGAVIPEHPEDTMHSHVCILNTYINNYFIHKAKLNHDTSLFKLYMPAYNNKKIQNDRSITSKDYTLNLMNWMRAVLYKDAIEYHNTYQKDALVIIQSTMQTDSYLCKNTKIGPLNVDAIISDLVDADPDEQAINMLDIPDKLEKDEADVDA